MSESFIYKPNDFNISKVSTGARVFVTGGSGLVGSHLINNLIERGRPVRASFRKAIPGIKNKEKVDWVQGDILDVSFLQEAFQDIDHVYHCAGVVSYDPAKRKEMVATNIEGTANVVNTALDEGVKKLCFVSSVAALGQKRKSEPIDETMVWSEDTSSSNYGKSKYLAEMEVWRGMGEGLDSVIVNPSIILGAGNWNEGSTKIFKTAFDEFPWYTEGQTGFVDVNDVVRIMIELMENNISGERFIISAENRTYREVFTSIANAFGKEPPHKKVTPFIASTVWRIEALKSVFTNKTTLLTRETARAAQSIVEYNNSKLSNYLPWFTYTPLEKTIKRVCGELQQNRFNKEN